MHKRKNFRADDPAWDALEARWIAQMAGDDQAVASAALGSMFLAYNDMLRGRLVRARIHPDEIDDIAQQVWVDLARAAPRYPGDIPVRLFVFRYFAYGRKRYWSDRKAAPPVDSLSDEAVEALAERAILALRQSPTDSSQYLEFARCVRGALSAFDRVYPRQASLLVFKHMEGRSLKEIADRSGERPDTIKSELFSARKKFGPRVRRCLDLWPDWESRE